MKLELKVKVNTVKWADAHKFFNDHENYFLLYNDQPLAGVDGPGRIWAESTAGNIATAQRSTHGDIIITYEGRRHALKDRGNVAGHLFFSLGLIDQAGQPTIAARAAVITRYESQRPDLFWWQTAVEGEK